MESKDKPLKYDSSHRIVLFQTDDKGNCKPQVVVPEIASELVDALYEARSQVWSHFKEEVDNGNVSPIRLYFEYFNMNEMDLASRMKMSVKQIQKHFTMEGFKKCTIETLIKYALIFDIAVGDFFQFMYIDDSVSVEPEVKNERIIQNIKISKK